MKHINPNVKNDRRGLIDLLLWMMGAYKDPRAHLLPPPGFTFPNPKSLVDKKKPSCTWLGHSTFLIQIEGTTFLTDPIWTQRCSPIPFLGPKRKCDAPIKLKDLPKIDTVLISHDHYDHLDKKSVKELMQLFPTVVFIVPTGVKEWFVKNFPKFPSAQIIELGWWETFSFSSFEVTAVPAQHFSGRNPFKKNRTLWLGIVVTAASNQKFYFGGDTGYNDYDFKEIGRRFGKIDLSLLPIGAYVPSQFMRPVHIDPFEAVKIHKEVNSRLSVGGHFGTFKLSSEHSTLPPYELFNALEKENIPWKEFRVLEQGQAINW